MKLHTSLLVVLGVALGLAASGCKQSDSAASAGAGSASASGAATASAKTPDPLPPAPQASADYLKVTADHTDPSKGPVEIAFASWKVVNATFDPANLEGGTAELEVDPASLSSGIAKRDAHLKNPDYLDVTAFPTATVKIANVKKTGEKSYTADATVSIHGIEQTWSLPFEVVSATADSVQVRFSQPFSRLDFGIGKSEAEDASKAQVTLQGQLTIKRT